MWGIFWLTVARNPISTFAVLCVAAIGVYLGYMTNQLLAVLTSPNWCATAIHAEKISPGNTYVGLTTCVSLLTIQLEALATGFHVSVGGFVLTLLVLVVVVIAGAKASGKLPGGIEFDVGADPVAKAADKVAGAAVDQAEVIKGEN